MRKSSSLIASIVLSALLVWLMAAGMAGYGLEEYRWIGVLGDDARPMAFALYLGFTFLLLAALFFAVFQKAPEMLSRSSGRESPHWERASLSKKSIALCTLVIFACWLPYIIIQFPMSFNNDAYVQLFQYRTGAPTFYTTLGQMLDAEFIDHHPVFDTIVFGSVLEFGDLIGSQSAGLFLFSLCQCALISASLACSCCYLALLGVPTIARRILVAVCALLPFMPLIAATMMKDSLHIAFFVFFCLACIEIVRSDGNAWEQQRFGVFLIVMASLCILTKKTGFFIVGISLLVLVLLYGRGRILQAAGSSIAPLLICCLVFPAVIYPLLGGVAPGGRQESFGAVLQQVVTAYRSDPSSLTGGELDAVDRVVDLERAVGRYDERNVDPVKNSFRQDADTSDLLGFVPAYITIGVKHPYEYLISIGEIAVFLISPSDPMSYFNSCENVYEDENDAYWKKLQSMEEDPGFTFSRPSKLQAINAKLKATLKKPATRLPVLGWPFTKGFYGGWIPIACFFIALVASRRKAVAFMPLFVAFAFVLISPIPSARYVIPMLFSLPLLIGVACWALRSVAHGHSPT